MTLSSLVLLSRPSGHDRPNSRYLPVHLGVAYGWGCLVRAFCSTIARLADLPTQRDTETALLQDPRSKGCQDQGFSSLAYIHSGGVRKN